MEEIRTPWLVLLFWELLSYLCEDASPAVATVLILGNCVGWYLDSMVGVQIRTLIWGADSHS
jgi:hypothetical protein